LDKYFTTQEISQALHVHRLTVVNWIRAGKLKAVKLAGLRFWRIRDKDLRRFLRAR
jgi:excisionase family DNA binding protein